MKHTVSFIFIMLLALFSSLTYASKVIYVGTYTHDNKPAVMVQFDEKSYNKNIAQIIDVKTNEDLSNHWIFNENNSALIKLKNKTTIIVCQSGARSKKAAKKLVDLGFSDLHVLSGGLAGWTKENLPINSNKNS